MPPAASSSPRVTTLPTTTAASSTTVTGVSLCLLTTRPWPDTIAEVERVERMPFDRGVSTGLIREISESVHVNYIAANLAAVSPPARPWIPVVFTPLHGTAHTSVGDVLEAAGVP